MNEPKFMFNCQLCGASFQFGPHVYSGKHIARYDLTVCGACWAGNHDGWSPSLEPKFLEHLKSKGVAVPERNSAGWYSRE